VDLRHHRHSLGSAVVGGDLEPDPAFGEAAQHHPRRAPCVVSASEVDLAIRPSFGMADNLGIESNPDCEGCIGGKGMHLSLSTQSCEGDVNRFEMGLSE